MNTEVLHLRTINTKTFDLGNGQYQLQGFENNIHYQDENGQWQDMDYNIVNNRVYKCEYDVTLLQNNIGYTGKDIKGYDIRVELKHDYVKPIIEGNKATYPLSEHTDFEIVFTSQGIGTHIIIKSEKGEREHQYQLYRHEDSPWSFVTEGVDSEGQKLQLKVDQEFLGRPKEYEHYILKQQWTGNVAVMDPETRKKHWSETDVKYPVYIS